MSSTRSPSGITWQFESNDDRAARGAASPSAAARVDYDGVHFARSDPCYYGDRREFRRACVGAFRDAELLQSFGVDDYTATMFFDRVYDSYGKVPYHCANHAKDVLLAAHALMREVIAEGHGPFTDVERLALYVAAVGHDAGHFGVNNDFLKNSDHPLLAVYPTSTLERYHAHIMTEHVRDPEYGVSRFISEANGDRARFESLMREIILATDISAHKGILGGFAHWVDEIGRERRESGNEEEAEAEDGDDDDDDDATESRGEISPALANRADRSRSRSSRRRGWVLNEDQRESLLKITIKCADLNAVAADISKADAWGLRIVEEQATQGEREVRERVQRTFPSRDVILADYYNCQAYFGTEVVRPLFEAFMTFASAGFRDVTRSRLSNNLRAWQRGHRRAYGLRATRERENEFRRAVMSSFLGAIALAVYTFSRRELLTRQLADLKLASEAGPSGRLLDECRDDGARLCSFAHLVVQKGGVPTVAATLRVVISNARFWMTCFAVYIASACACLGCIILSASEPRYLSRALSSRFVLAYMHSITLLRFAFCRLRHVLATSFYEAKVRDFAFAPLMSNKALSGQKLLVALTDALGVNVVPALFSCLFFAGAPGLGIRYHFVCHAAICALRFHSEASFEGDIFAATMENMVGSVLAFPALVAILEPRTAARLVPGFARLETLARRVARGVKLKLS